MGAAVGYALTQPPVAALAVFEALGLGLALPFLALSLVPAWRRLLPRPGPWMARLEQALAFPLYASVAWLVWVVSRQAGPDGVAARAGGPAADRLRRVAPPRRPRPPRPRWRRAATGFAPRQRRGGDRARPRSPRRARRRRPPAARAAPAWEPSRPTRLAELRAQGKPVFVNFTAAWCITCLVNERVALRSPAVAEAFARKGVVYLKADWTSRSAEIASVLSSFGRSGVPLYVIYPVTGRARGRARARACSRRS